MSNESNKKNKTNKMRRSGTKRTPREKVGPRSPVDRATVLTLAIRAEIDPRTARRALEEGPEACRPLVRERVRRALEAMGIRPRP